MRKVVYVGAKVSARQSLEPGSSRQSCQTFSPSLASRPLIVKDHKAALTLLGTLETANRPILRVPHASRLPLMNTYLFYSKARKQHIHKHVVVQQNRGTVCGRLCTPTVALRHCYCCARLLL